MRIDFDTSELDRHDALSLAVLIHAKYPDVFSTLSMMTAGAAVISRATAAGESRIPADVESLPSAEEAFGGEGAPSAVAPSPEEAFAGPQSVGASVSDPSDPEAPAASIPPASSSGPELDAAGLPWDGRIHSSNRKKTADGKWWAKKGVSNDTVAAVTAELKALLASPLASTTAAAAPSPPSADAPTSSTPAIPAAATVPAAPAAPAASAPIVPPAPAPGTTTGAPAASTATSPPSAPPPPLPPAAIEHAQNAALAEAGAPRPTAVLFTDVMRKVTDYTMAGKLTAEELNSVCQACGITSPRDLITQPGVVPTFLETLDAFVASKG